MPVSGKYRCRNPQCPSVQDSGRKAAKLAGTDPGGIVWNEDAVNLYCPHGVSFNTMSERWATAEGLFLCPSLAACHMCSACICWQSSVQNRAVCCCETQQQQQHKIKCCSKPAPSFP